MPQKPDMLDLARLDRVTTLLHGKHDPGGGMCLMEAVAFVAGQEWSDAPACVCPVIGAHMRAWNDNFSNDDDRTRLLKPLIVELIGTRGSEELEIRRAAMAADWLVRSHALAWLRLAGLDQHADTIATLPETTGFEQLPDLMPMLTSVRDDVQVRWDAASARASAANRAHAWLAIEGANWSATGDAARAAVDDLAAEHEPWIAVRDTLVETLKRVDRMAAWSASADDLRTTLAGLDQSALDLVARMIAEPQSPRPSGDVELVAGGGLEPPT
jgi:hypothetical protein